MPFGLYELFWFFVIYAFLGWCCEVAFVTVNTGKLVNRGFLNGPVCPIYGAGMVLVLVCLYPLQQNLLLLFLGGMLVTSFLELATGWALKTLFHTSWWDYSDKPFNIGGYVCLSFSLLWGIGVVGVMRVIHPMVAHLVAAVPRAVGFWLALPVGAAFAADAVLTVITITGLERDLGELEKLGEALHRGSDALTQVVGGTALAADDRLDEGKEHLEKKLPELEARRDFLRARMAERRMLGSARLLRAFPNMKNLRHTALLEEVKADLRAKLGR